MLIIDGSHGEGGGQVLRTSLALSLVTGKAFQIKRIRAGRRKPGLMRQHLTAVKAAARVGCAEVTGAELGSQELSFTPGAVLPGTYEFAVGTAGSATLVLQTVLPALLTASGPSELVLEGGTHNPFAPPFDFLHDAFLPVVNRMGPRVTANLERPGFFPAGGGRFTVSIEPASRLKPLSLLDRGTTERIEARAVVAQLSKGIGSRELKVVAKKLGLTWDDMRVEEVSSSRGPGNVLTVTVTSEHVTEVFTGFGQRDVRAEAVAAKAVKAAKAYLGAEVPVGPYLADQLLLPLALAGGGVFRTLAPTKHSQTNAEIIEQFLDVEIAFTEQGHNDWHVSVR